MKEVFRFKGIDDLYCDLDGKFFYKDKPARKVYNNGSISILINGSKKGVLSLRKVAYRDKVKEIVCPF